MNTARVSYRRKALVLCLLAAAAAIFVFSAPLQAQEGTEYDYVDLIVTYEYSITLEVEYTVRNIGTATATGVTVSFLLEDLQASTFETFPGGAPAPPTDKSTVDSTNQSFTWEVGTLAPGETPGILKFSTRKHDNSSGDMVGVITATASSNQPEPGFLSSNNVIKVYSYAPADGSTSKHMRHNLLALLLSVEDLSPDAGEVVDFDLTAQQLGSRGANSLNLVGEIEIQVELSDGLKFKQDWTPTAADKFKITEPGRQSATWTPNAVTPDPDTTRPNKREIEMEVQLTSDPGLNDIPLKERCITAWVEDSIPPPNPAFALGRLKQCLEDPPLELITSGDVDIFTLYDCFASNTAPCDSANGVRVRAVNRTVGYGTSFIMAKGTLLVHVRDFQGRTFDSHTDGSDLQSVTDGNTVSWQTATDKHSNFTGTRAGVKIFFTRSPFNGNLGNWDTISGEHVTIKGLDGGNPPGDMYIRLDDGTAITQMKSSNSWTATYEGGGEEDDQTSPNLWFAEFSQLGTYVMDYTTIADRKNDNTGDCATQYLPSGITAAYCDTETFTFHVGPIAELEVRDGGASPHAPADRNALTIVAFNNGPDTAPAARVTGLPRGAEALHASHGSYNSGTGVWNIGELGHTDLLQASGQPEGATLVLSASARDTASVTIANSKNYEVCIDSSGEDVAAASESACTGTTGNTWHTTPYYDYISGNNTATITAVRGTGGVGPGIPANPRAQTGATTVMWERVGLLYGLPVSHYEVEWLGGGVWRTLHNAVIGTQYGDTAPSGRRDYRVRAVNMVGATGPWSRSTVTERAGLAGPPVNLRTQADGNNAIDVSWDAPEDAGGSAVTGYTVQWSADGTSNWNNAGSVSDELTFKHRGLQVGAIRYYRVAARNRSGLGLWSDPVMGQTVSGAPEAPTLTAKTLSDYQIELTWNEPKDNGKPVTGYRIDSSSDGSANSWSQLATPGADPTAYTDSSLRANTQRYYRIRAVNSVGAGAWSRTVSARTQLTPPTAPSLTGVEADGPNAIVVTWGDPFLYEGELGITQYQVQYAKDQHSQIWRGPTTLSASARSWRHTGLKPNETWYYQVRATNGGNRWSPWSYSGSATTAADTAPKTVSSFRARYDKDADHVALTWNDSSGNGATFSYELERSENGGDWRMLRSNASCDAGKCSYEDTDLYPGSKLRYRVRAVNNEGDKGPWSGVQSATRPPNPPDEPWIHWIEADGSNHIVIEWEPPRYDGGADITGYRLLWCRALDGADNNPCEVTESNSPANPPGYSGISLGASARTYTHSVSPGYYYHYLLRATNGGNRWSEWEEYNILYARTYAGVPSAPGLTARAVASDQIRLTWNRPNSYGSEINTYWLYVYYDGDNLHDWDNILDIVSIPGDRTEWTIGDLDPETTHYFRVRALNDNGEGKYSVLRQATTPAN